VRAVLTYHSLDASGSPVSVDPRVFRDQMRWVASAGPAVVTLEALLEGGAPDDAVAITFDDGFSNLWTEGLPILEELGLPATVFVVTDRIGIDNGWDGRDYPGVPRLPLMGWDQVERLRERGFEVGAHSCTHPALTSVSATQLADEVHRCAEQIITRTGQRPSGFAYPFGAYDARVVGAVAEVYDMAVTTRLRVLPDRPSVHRIPRLDMYYLSRPGQLEAWGSLRFGARLVIRSGLRDARSWWTERGSRHRVGA
jgi:peptidoglycan/xylan/chitin deacetylase (PgdA/CDA1 family)